MPGLLTQQGHARGGTASSESKNVTSIGPTSPVCPGHCEARDRFPDLLAPLGSQAPSDQVRAVWLLGFGTLMLALTRNCSTDTNARVARSCLSGGIPSWSGSPPR